MSLFSIFSLIISTVGFFFCENLRSGFIFLFSQSLGLYFFHEDPLFLWIFAVFVWILMFCWEYFLFEHRQKRLQWHSLDYLNSCILQLESGFSLQNAMKESISCLPQDLKPVFELLWQNLFQLEQKNKFEHIFFDQLHQEIAIVKESSQKMTEQIRKIRGHIKKELYFRRRSGQILRSLRIQAVSMLVIYIVFVAIFEKQFHIFSYPKIFFCSAILFLTGFIMVLTMGRRLKWKT